MRLKNTRDLTIWFFVFTALWVSTTQLRAESPEGPEQAVKRVFSSLAEGDHVVIWQALPASYQKDIESLISDAVDKVDPEVFAKAVNVVRKTAKLLKDKREFILNGELAPQKLDKETLSEGYDAIANVLEILVNSELGNRDQLKKVNVEAFLSNTSPKLNSQFLALLKLLDLLYPGNDNLKKFHDAMEAHKNTKIIVVKADATEATLRIERPAADKVSEEQVFIKVEGKWLPKFMVDWWAKGMEDAKTGLSQAGPLMSDDFKQQLLQMLDMAEEHLDKLENTKTKKEFTQAVRQIFRPLFPAGFPF